MLSPRQCAVIVAVLCTGAAVSGVLFGMMRRAERDRARMDFKHAAEDRISVLEREVEGHLLIVESTACLFAGSQEVERNEFRTFVAPLLRHHPDIQALEWILRVPDAQRAVCEAEARNDGLGSFQITERNTRGRMVPAQRRGEYYPVYFVEPREGNEAALGFDLASSPACLEVLNRARDTGRMAATSRLTLVQERGGQFSFLVFLPVYRKGAPADSVAARRENLEGFVRGVFPVAALTAHARSHLEPWGVDIRFLDESMGPDKRFLLFHRSRMREGPGSDPPGDETGTRAEFKLTGSIKVADRKWSVLCTSAPCFLEARITWQPWVGLVAGLVATGLLGAYVATTTIRGARAKHLAARLSRANRELESEAIERRRAEKEMAKLAKFPDENPNPVLRISSDGLILYGNEAGGPLLDVWGCGSDRPLAGRWRQLVTDALGSGQSRQAELKCGDRAFFLVFAPVVDSGYVNVYALDITDRKAAEEKTRSARREAERVNTELARRAEELDAARKASLNMVDDLERTREAAEVANRAKSAFLANMSHEIRTPMTAILGYMDLMEDHGLSQERRKEHLEVIRRNGEHLLALINDVLDLSKIEAGRLEMEIAPCCLPSILADLASLMRVRAKEKGIALAVEYDGVVPETIRTDPAHLRQALVNLVGNAVKFTEQGGVRIVASLPADWKDGAPGVQFRVIDTGIGIEEARLRCLFEPFTQADPSTSRKYGGTGLGLAITHHIAELLGGEVTVQSSPGKGSTFTLTIPTGPLEGVNMLDSPAEAARSKPADSDPVRTAEGLAGLRVLLAEDGIDNQRLITAILRNAGAEVEVAANGRIAVEKASTGRFDVVLMDMQMPEMDGYDATRALRARGLSVPVLALTAHAMSGDREKCLAAGCSDHLTKPINRPALIAAIVKYADECPAPEEPGAANGVLLSELADADDLAEIINGFVAGLDGHVRQMHDALNNGDHDRLRRLAHQMKGAGGSYGYPQLTQAARLLEDAAKAGDVEAATLALAEFAEMSAAALRGRPAATARET